MAAGKRFAALTQKVMKAALLVVKVKDTVSVYTPQHLWLHGCIISVSQQGLNHQGLCIPSGSHKANSEVLSSTKY